MENSFKTEGSLQRDSRLHEKKYSITDTANKNLSTENFEIS